MHASTADFMNGIMKLLLVLCPVAVVIGLVYWRKGGRVVTALALMLGSFPAEYFFRSIIEDNTRLAIFAVAFLAAAAFLSLELRRLRRQPPLPDRISRSEDR